MSEEVVPGFFIEEAGRGPRPIEGVGTTTAGFVGQSERGPATPLLVRSFAEYERDFGGFLDPSTGQGYLAQAAFGFFQNGGTQAYVARVCPAGGDPYDPAAYLGVAGASGVDALEAIEDVAMLCVPDQPLIDERHAGAMTAALVAQCERRRDRICLLQSRACEANAATDLRVPTESSFAAFYHPWILAFDPAGGAPVPVPAVGHVAGMFVRSDAAQGVWKAPAGRALGPVAGAAGLAAPVPDALQQVLNPRGVNCLRRFAGLDGVLVWGARSCAGSDALASDYKYVNVRRLAIFIEQSVGRGLRWVAFEPNGSATWANVARSVSDFLTTLWRAGALAGDRPQQAFFVKCDASTMTPDDIASGRLVCEIGIAPAKPAEFVLLRIGQWTREARDEP